MFGYIVVNQPELKMKEYDEYRIIAACANR